jgi:hypothetical protein
MRRSGLLIAAILLLSADILYGELPIIREEFRFDESPRVIRLSNRNIISNTLRVEINGEVAGGDDYILDANSGTLKINCELEAPVVITVEYSRFWVNLPSYYFKRKLGAVMSRSLPGDASSRESTRRPPVTNSGSSSLRIFGSKSFGITAGSGTDLELKQTLNVQIEGYLTENLKVSGVLSDQAAPEVGGISTSIGEIDRVALKLSSDRFSASVGDIDFDRRMGAHGQLKKALKGASAQISAGKVGADATLGGIKSKHATKKILGRDGVSGPYRLLPDVGQSSVSILPSTDRVWLDGRPLARGADADYEIDYLLGEITFSPAITVTSRSRIEADFEYLDEDYRQDFFAGGALYGDSTLPLFARIDFLRQADSENDPTQFDLSPDDISVLRAAGDFAMKALKSGVVKADSGQGNYSLEVVGSDTIYTFAGTGNGDYRVSFSYMGPGNGDYRYLGGGVYEYVSQGGGEYLPVVRIPLPESASALSLTTSAGNDRFRIRFDGTASKHDRNLLSELDDNDNDGMDISGGFNLTPFGRNAKQVYLNIGFNARLQDEKFFFPGRSDLVERDRYWGILTDSIADESVQLSLTEVFRIAEIAELSADFGVLGSPGAHRYSYDLTLAPTSDLNGRVMRLDRYSERSTNVLGNSTKSHSSKKSFWVPGYSSNRLYEDLVSLKWTRSDIKALFEWNDETDLRAYDSLLQGRRFDRYSGACGFRGFETRLSYENREALTGVFEREFDAREIEARYQGGGGFKSSDARLSVRHRRVHYFIPTKFEQSQLTTSLDYSAGNSGSLVQMSVNYRLSREGVDRTAETFIRVGDGQGEYRLEDDIYVPDPFGDYIRVVEFSGAEDVGVKMQRGAALFARFNKWKSCPASLAFLKRLTLEARVRSNEQGGESEQFDIVWLVPHVSLFTDTRSWLDRSLRLSARAKASDQLSFLFTIDETQLERPQQRPASSDYRLSIMNRAEAKLTSRDLLTLEYRYRGVSQSNQSLGDARFDEHQVKCVLRHNLTVSTELVLKPRYLLDISRDSDLEVTLLEAGAEIWRRFPSRGRVGAQFAYQNVSVSVDNTFVPFQYADGKRFGENYQWGLSAELRFSKSMSARLSYDGEKIPSVDTRHVSSVTVRARF